MQLGFKTSESYLKEMNAVAQEFNQKISDQGIAWLSFQGSEIGNIPPGFTTVGFTNIGLPEFYVSGLTLQALSNPRLINMVNFIINLYHVNKTNTELTNKEPYQLMDCVNIINGIIIQEDLVKDFVAFPVNADRHLYGQGILLRHWGKVTNQLDQIKVVQLHWATDGEFPMTSTKDQLLLDWQPFGWKNTGSSIYDISTEKLVENSIAHNHSFIN